LKIEGFVGFLQQLFIQSTEYEGKPITLNTLLHERVRQFYDKFCKENSDNLTEVNKQKIVRVSAFEKFIQGLKSYLVSFGYFEKFLQLEGDLEKVKKLFPLNLAKSYERNTLYFEFLQRNQLGLHVDDVQRIFMLMKVESFAKEEDKQEKKLDRESPSTIDAKLDYVLNLQRMISVMLDYKEKIIDAFSLHKNFQNKVSLNDYLLVMRDIKAVDPNLHFYLSLSTKEELTTSPQSMEMIFARASEYFHEYLGVSKQLYPKIEMIDFGYDVYWEFFDYLLKTADTFCIDYRGGGEEGRLIALRADLRASVDNYKGRVDGGKTEFEKKLILGRPWFMEILWRRLRLKLRISMRRYRLPRILL
jgi:hypothetical protein